ncbi:ribonuclease H-like domain-containing protein [Mycena alexandri]|uniref:3'-5' exonuclease n=1 Tax=Mycena alexandri TaxID=1745969 RepID=A0AAD6TFK0_9AGAR|nr:ribonuclease H-like domain-containing protein [Mycena alexandri]
MAHLATGNTDPVPVSADAQAPIIFPYPRKVAFHLVKTAHTANLFLRSITAGYVGLDTEFTTRTPSPKERSALEATDGSKRSRLLYLKRRVHEAGPDGIQLDFDRMGLCLVQIVQIATDTNVFIMDLKRIKSFPRELRRILESDQIAKVGTGFLTDGKVLFEDAGCNVRCFRDLGFLMRLVFAEQFATSGGPIALDVMVRFLLQRQMSKDLQQSDWSEEYDEEDPQILYAGLDAQASRELYTEMLIPTRDKESAINQRIQDDWFCFDFIDGEARTRSKSSSGDTSSWSYTLCPWYRGGKFSAYHR